MPRQSHCQSKLQRTRTYQSGEPSGTTHLSPATIAFAHSLRDTDTLASELVDEHERQEAAARMLALAGSLPRTSTGTQNPLAEIPPLWDEDLVNTVRSIILAQAPQAQEKRTGVTAPNIGFDPTCT